MRKEPNTRFRDVIGISQDVMAAVRSMHITSSRTDVQGMDDLFFQKDDTAAPGGAADGITHAAPK
jgi:hypothetical protein